MNLISISAVTNVDLSVHFIESRVTFARPEDRSVIMVCERIGESLYHLAIRSKSLKDGRLKDSACFVVPSPASLAVWHKRLVHVNYKTNSRMVSNIAVDGLKLPYNDNLPTEPCLGCVSG